MTTWNTKYASSAAVDLVVTATESDVNIANNTSKVTVTIQLKSSANQTAWNGYSQSLGVSIDGVSVGSKSFTYSIPAGGTVTLGTYSRVVTHSSDGTKSARIQVSASGGGDSGSIDKYLGLTTIARASEVTVTPSTVNFGESVRVKIHKKSSGFTSTVKVAWGTTNLTIWEKVSWTDGDWTVPTSLAPSTATTGWGRIIVETYNGTTLVGTKETRLNGVVPNTAAWNPTANTPTLTEKNTKISSGITGVWVAGQSKVEYKATFTTRMGATAKSATFRVVNNGRTYNHTAAISGTTATFIDSPGSVSGHTVQLIITDSRDRTHTSSAISFTPVAYSPPALSVAKADRKAASPTTILISATASGSHLSNKNTMTLKIYVKNRTTTSWGTAKHTVTSTNGSITLTNHALAGYAETESFDVRFELYDELSAAVYSQTTISTTRVPLDVYKDIGVGVGKMYEEGTGGPLQVGPGTSVFDGGIHVRGPLYMAGGIQPEYIQANGDLNSLIKPGLYHCPTNAEAYTITNKPLNTAFSLLVERHAGIKQTFTIYNQDGKPRTFIRNSYSDIWGAWSEVMMGVPDTSWVNVSLQSGFTGNIQIRQYGNFVYLRGFFKGNAGDNKNLILFAIPSSISKPGQNLDFEAVTGAGASNGWNVDSAGGYINAITGNVYIGRAISSNTSYWVDSVRYMQT